MRTTAAGAAVFFLVLTCVGGCRRQQPDASKVVVYTSVDQIYAQQVFDLFTERTGIQVLQVTDTEAGKTTGLFNRLLAERDRPRADVFWNGEICRTIELADAGIAGDVSALVPDDLPRRWADPEGRWIAFSLRARVIVYNTYMLEREDVPTTLEELTAERWRGQVAIAKPLFGTTATHAAALYEVWGEERTDAFFQGLRANRARVVEGNSVVRDMVARGAVPLGLTDTDDCFAGMIDGKPLDFVLPDQDGIGTLAIPNSVMIVAGGPNPEAARRFVRFLLEPQVEQSLAFARARQVPVRQTVPRPDDLSRLAGLRAMDVDYGRVAARMGDTARRMEEIFLR